MILKHAPGPANGPRLILCGENGAFAALMCNMPFLWQIMEIDCQMVDNGSECRVEGGLRNLK